MAVNMGKCVLVLVVLLTITTWAQVNDDDMMEESLDTDVSLDEFDLEETCDQVAQARWNYHLNPTKHTLQNKINEEQKYGDELRREAERMTFNLQLSLKSSQLQRKIELLAKPGAALLSEENFNKMVVFSNNVEDIKYTKYNICSESSVEQDCEMMNLQDIENGVVKQPHLWKEYSNKWPDLTHNFSQVLHLADQEATLNGAADVQKYWEDITEFAPGYNRAASLWKQIQPLYKQLHRSISSLISKRYKMHNKGTIPLLYLGSVSGSDWSSLADIIFTRSNSQYHHIKGKLRGKDISSVTVYRAAEKMVLRLGLEKTSSHFWNESKFDHTCPTKSTSFCKEIRVRTCAQPDWLEYLTAHEVMMQAAHRHLEESLVFRENNHHSALHEAVSGLGSLLAATPKQLELEGILPPTEEEEEEDDVKYTLLILMALHTLPRLPYYLAADMWRLDAIKNNQTDPAQLRNSWIKLRDEMQMVSVPDDSNDWLQLLSDPYIVNNKPYLGKFVGVILQFQLLELFTDNQDISLVDAVHLLGSDDKFRALLQAGFSKPWPDVLEDIAKISYIDAKPLLNFFNELEDALDQEVDIDLPADSHSDMKSAVNVDESDEIVEESTEKQTVEEPSSTEREDSENETETETVTGIRLADVQNQNVSAEIPSNTETENKTAESSGTGTILLFSITAVIAVVAVVAFFLVGRKRFVRSHLYRQPPDQNTPA